MNVCDYWDEYLSPFICESSFED